MCARIYGIHFLKQHTKNDILTINRRFPTNFRRFLEIFQKLSEGHTNVNENVSESF